MTTAERLKALGVNPKAGVVGASIITRSGRYFDFLDPQPDMIEPEDIAWGLAQTCRFGGQSLHYYSVAQHCVLVSETVSERFAFEALMHDAAEAYVGDVVGPLKQLLPDYKIVEDRVERAIADKFGLSLPWHEEIKLADLRLLRTEQRDLTAGHAENWNGLDTYQPLQRHIVPWSVYRAANNWLREFRRLAP